MSKEINYVGGQIDALTYMTEIYANIGNTKMSLTKADEAISLVSRDKKYIMEYSTLLIAKGVLFQSLDTSKELYRFFRRL